MDGLLGLQIKRDFNQSRLVKKERRQAGYIHNPLWTQLKTDLLSSVFIP